MTPIGGRIWELGVGVMAGKIAGRTAGKTGGESETGVKQKTADETANMRVYQTVG